ncbi:phage holin family protein [Actinomyces sp. B33]|uniref:phage holin family protein n=1 Tax=Actinomyces sp. B33 TaxID=2942131 RepID=UPI00234221E5|nr:phage holin family protein [Actinomyces sp. B33]MDC4233480.1 phage holin family protein [Actinomyces sp. B33]
MTTPIEPVAPDHPAGDDTPIRTYTRALSRPATVGELFAALSSQVSTLINGEIELTKVKAKALVKKAGTGGALLAGAAVLSLYLLGWVLHTIEVALAIVLPAWAASLIVAGILLLIVAVLAGVGVSLVKKSRDDKPDPKAGIEKGIDAVKKGLGK